MRLNTVSTVSEAGILATNKVLKNTYLLLSMTLLFSAACAGLAMAFNLPHPGLIITLVGYFGLLFLTTKFSNSAWGIVCVFALTGFMGMTLGPILNHYVNLKLATVLPWNLPVKSQKLVRTEAMFSAISDCIHRFVYRLTFLFGRSLKRLPWLYPIKHLRT